MQPNNFIPLKNPSFDTLADIFHEMMSVVCLYHQPRIHKPLSNAAITSHHSPLTPCSGVILSSIRVSARSEIRLFPTILTATFPAGSCYRMSLVRCRPRFRYTYFVSSTKPLSVKAINIHQGPGSI